MAEIFHAQPASVRVYLNGCVVTSTGTLALTAGTQQVLVDCLANNVAEDSLRVRLPKEISLLSVAVAYPDSAEKDEFEQKANALRKKIARTEARAKNRSDQKELWIALAHASNDPEDLASREAYLERLPGHLDALDDELAELRRELDCLNDELAATLARIQEERIRARRGLLCLRLLSPNDVNVPLEVQMRSSRASWRPVYDVLVDDFECPVRIRLRAAVTQSTGIDWQDVRITLSTIAPASNGSLPRLLPMRLRKHVDRPAPSFGSMARASAPMAAAFSSSDDTIVLEEAAPLPQFDMQEAAPPQAQASSLANSMEYAVPGTWHIAPDEEALVEVQTSSFGARYEWRAVPSLDDSVYIAAVLEEALDAQAVGNEASVYLEGEYCGTVLLAAPAARESFEVSLGPDARMSCSRTLVHRRAARTILRGRESEELCYELCVKSERAEEARLVLLDQVPLAEDKEIAVERGDCDGARYDEDTGELRWSLALPAQGEVSRRFAYTVSHPKGIRVDTVRM